MLMKLVCQVALLCSFSVKHKVLMCKNGDNRIAELMWIHVMASLGHTC